MKVKVYVRRWEAVEVEIDDKFRELAVPHPWENANITAELVDEAIAAVEQACNLPFGDEAEDGGLNESFIEAVHSAENGETMLEW